MFDLRGHLHCQPSCYGLPRDFAGAALAFSKKCFFDVGHTIPILLAAISEPWLSVFPCVPDAAKVQGFYHITPDHQ